MEPITFHYIYAAILGAIIGSFLNVVILRWPRKMVWSWRKDALEWLSEKPDPNLGLEDDIHMREASKAALKRMEDNPTPPGIIVKGSHCPKCKAPIRWYDNLPVLGWIMLGGKCRSCKQKISIQYPLVELLCAGLAAIAVAVFGWNVSAVAASVFLGLLVVLSMIDARTMYLPDDLVLPGMWLALLWSLVASYYFPGMAISPTAALWGAILGYAGLASIVRGYGLITGREGMGGGDLKLLGLIGAFLGPGALVPVIGLSAVGGAVLGIILKLRRGESRPFPFGPWLAMAAAFWLFVGQPCGWEKALVGS